MAEIALDSSEQAQLEAFVAGAGLHGRDLVRLELDALGALSLLGALQLVCRHPAMARGLASYYRELGDEIAEQLPECLRPIAAAGWLRVNDG